MLFMRWSWVRYWKRPTEPTRSSAFTNAWRPPWKFLKNPHARAPGEHACRLKIFHSLRLLPEDHPERLRPLESRLKEFLPSLVARALGKNSKVGPTAYRARPLCALQPMLLWEHCGCFGLGTRKPSMRAPDGCRRMKAAAEIPARCMGFNENAVVVPTQCITGRRRGDPSQRVGRCLADSLAVLDPLFGGRGFRLGESHPRQRLVERKGGPFQKALPILGPLGQREAFTLGTKPSNVKHVLLSKNLTRITPLERWLSTHFPWPSRG